MKSKNQIAVEEWRRRTRLKLIQGFGGKCCICGYSKSHKALCFHHLDPNQKEFGISNGFMNNKSWTILVEEVQKCVLVCHNCHMEIHDDSCDTLVPDNAPKFDQSLIDFKQLYDSCKCGKPKKLKNSYCSLSCAANSRGFDWDSVDVISLYHKFGSFNAVAKELGISGVAVSKRLRKIGAIK